MTRKPGLPSDTQITGQASIVFDVNAAMETPQTLNTVDVTPPTSSVSPLPATESQTNFTVSWSGQDLLPDSSQGAGIASYNVYVSDDDGPFTLWQSDTTQTSATYTGVVGQTYSFYSVATDNVGNVQPTPTSAQATTTVVSPLTITSIAAVSPNPRNTAVSSIDVTFSEPINLTTFTDAALTLTDNGGSNLITSAVTRQPGLGLDLPDQRPVRADRRPTATTR